MANRNPSLDVLRGVAVFLVVLFHVGVPFFNHTGWIGVDLFFVLSGFLISGVLFHDYEKLRRVRFGRFWLRRAFKILPPLYAFLAVMAVLMFSLHIFTGKAFASSVLFYSNYLPNPNSAGSLIGHTWSLAIEEHFYLILPLLFSLLITCRPNQPFAVLPLTFAVLMVACFTFRLRDPDHYAFTHMRVDALFAGVTLRYWERFKPAWFVRFSRPYSLAFGLSFFGVPLIPISDRGLANAVSFGASYLTAVFLVGWCFSHDRMAAWRSAPFRVLARIGFASYSIYLWQQPICLLAKDISPGWFFKPCGILFSTLMGLVMAHLAEFPALAWRDRFLGKTVKSEAPPMYSASPLPARIQS